MTRSSFLVLFCSIAVVGGLTGCGGSAAETTVGETSVVTTTPSVASVPATVAGADTTAGRTLRVTFRSGEVTGDTNPSVTRGERVTIAVTSDVADQLHLHGYDLEYPLVAGQTQEFSFVAEIPGKFELELHDNPVKLLTLAVR